MSDIAHRYTKEIVCPYCGCVFSNSCEYGENDGELFCDDCGNEFSYCRDMEITYTTTKKDCKERGEEHDYKLYLEYDRDQEYVKNSLTGKTEWISIPPVEHVKHYKCTKCESDRFDKSPIEKKEKV